MRVCWMFMILLSCRLSHGTQSQSTCTCNEELKTICAPGREHVLVPCPNVTADDLRFNLIKDQENICNVTCTYENNTWKCVAPHNRLGVELHLNRHHKLTGFNLTGLNIESHGIYRCESTATFPPPLKFVPSDVRVRVLAEGHPCKCNKGRNKHENPNHGLIWIWILVVVLLVIYSLTVSIIAFALWIKLRKTDSQSDYMNTKPRAPKDRKKKRGVQNPIPRHF